MRSVLKSYLGMIGIGLAALLVLGTIAVKIDQANQGDVPPAIDATPAISGNAPDVIVDSRWMMKYGSSVEYIFDLNDLNDYEAGHIPGAHHLWWQDAMAQHPRPYGQPDNLSRVPYEGDIFGRMHLDAPQNARIVLYDDHGSARASWMAWVMKMAGYTDVLVLDGGLSAWMGAGGDVTTDPPAAYENATLTTVQPEKWVIKQEDLQQQLDSPRLRLIDTRDTIGMTDTVNATVRVGHIPGAINITNHDVLRGDGTFKSKDELIALFNDAGIAPGDQVVVYSLFSTDSGPVWLALQIAGYTDASVYLEGYQSWGKPGSDLPIDTSNFAEPEPAATPRATPLATPEEGPTDLTGD